MSIRINNAPDVARMNTGDSFKPSGANPERTYNPGYSYVRQSYLGSDLLQLSDDYAPNSRSYNQSYYSYNYSNFGRLLLIFTAIIVLMALSLSALVVLGGLVSVVVFALIVLVSVFLYSVNLNPFDKRTYKKVAYYLR